MSFGIVCRMTNDIPLADNPYPLANQTRTGFLKNHITRPNILVGDYTYYDDPAGMQEFERNVLYHFDFIGDRLIIGKFCSIATGVKFIMNGGNHRTDWLTNYPSPSSEERGPQQCLRSGPTRETPSSATMYGSAMAPP